MKAKIDLEKFICSWLKARKYCSDNECWYVIAALKEQGLDYNFENEEIVEIEQEQPSEKDYEDLSIINEGGDGVLLYFTKDGRGISDFRISKDTARWLHRKLEEYLEMYDAEQPKEPEEQEDLRKRYERIGKSDWFKKTHEGMSITIPDNLVGTDMDGGVVGEKGEEGKAEPFEEKVEHWIRMGKIAEDKVREWLKEKDNNPEHVGMGELGKVWSEQAIISRLDKIIELLSWKPSPNIIPYPYTMPITYKRPLDPDPNVLGGWTTTASTFGSDYDIDTDKIKQDETNKSKS